MSNNEVELIETKNKIKTLEEEIVDLKKKLETIENNMNSKYVGNWVVVDSYGEGRFYGDIYWAKSKGEIIYDNQKRLEGNWDLNGNIMNGKLYSKDNHSLLREWINSKEIEVEKKIK